jgi:DNA-binding beta-propeller fold protein YncE
MKRERTPAPGADRVLRAVLASLLLSCAARAAAEPNPYSQTFTAFESGQVRPLALTPNKQFLLAVNTPDAKLEIFRISNDGLAHRVSVPVGLEPVSVAVRNDEEAWVVNHLSDSISVVSLKDKDSHVRQTLLVGDEPRDIVFAGRNHNRAFITTAHRGQNSPIDPQLTTPSVGRADVWVFDANRGGTHRDGEPLTILTLFADTPRALAVTPDGSKVYAAAFFSGNGTASAFAGTLLNLQNPLPPFKVFDFFPLPLNVNVLGEPQPITSAIVKYDGAHWKDETGLIRDAEMMFTLPDRDVFAIDANANPPRAITGPGGVYSHVGTTLFNMIINPANGKVYVSNLESNNMQRFEGANHFAGGVTKPDPSVRGRIAFSRITVLDELGHVTPRHLNKHINYAACCGPNPIENATSVAFPLGMEITSNGRTLYVAAVGSSEVAVYDTRQLENDTFVPTTASQIPPGLCTRLAS